MRLWLMMFLMALGSPPPVLAGDGPSDEDDSQQEEEQDKGRERKRGRGHRYRYGKGRGRGHGAVHGGGRARGAGKRRRHRHGHKHRHGYRGHLREDRGDGEEIDPVKLVQRLINEERLDEAEQLLNGMEGDEAVLESFRGILAMKRDQHIKAIPHFKHALALKPTQTAVWLYLGQAYFQAEKYGESLNALVRGEKAGRQIPSYYQLRARAEEKTGRIEDAYETLERARGIFPAHHELAREQALLLVKEGLFVAALEKGQEYIANKRDDRNGYLILGEAMRNAGRPYDAAVFLEAAAIRFEQDPEVLARLAFAYSENQRTLAAAKLFARATRLGGDYAFAAAEHFRLSGRVREAIEMNALVREPRKRLSQRLAVYLGAEHFGRAASLERTLIDAGALDDTNKYRLAYAHFRTGDLDRARELCLQVEDHALKESATKLLEAVNRERRRE